MDTKSLESLPDDLILDIVEHLNAAHDIAHLGSSSRRFRNFVQHDGWRAFAKSGFPSLNIPFNESTQWDTMANRLTYLDRCWEKRGFLIHEFQEQQQKGRRQRTPAGRQSVSFHPVLDARLLSDLQHELVAWGAGEDLVTRLSSTSRNGLEQWHRLNGHRSGYSSGFGDVTAVSVIDRKASPEILVARANGDLQLVASTGYDFGKTSQLLLPTEELAHGNGGPTPRKSPGQAAISWTEWNPSANVVASCRSTTLTVHNLSDTEARDLRPMVTYDLSQDSAADEVSLVRSAKFMNRDTIACALGGTYTPIRYGKITPTGLEFFNAADNRDSLAYLGSLTEVTLDEKTTVRAIEAVGRGQSESLLLSAWDDGTYRLNDIRTPSPHDAIYRDRWEVYEAGSSLLVYGTQRFVAGSNMSASLRFFDFRNPKPYHYTNALSCSTDPPSPPPPRERPQGWKSPDYPCKCDNQRSRSCIWHTESREDYWRPDTTLHLSSTRYDRVHALAKASDISDTFYCGLQGSVTEMTLRLAEDVTLEDIKRTAPPGWRPGKPRGKVAIVETGVAICRENEWEQQNSGYPELWYQLRQQPLDMRTPGAINRSRYDAAYRHHTEVSTR